MPRLAGNLSMLFNEVDFPGRFRAASEAGFTGVEYLFPYDNDKNELADTLQRNGLTQVLHNLPAGDFDAGDRGLACLADRVGEFQDSVALALEYATALGCPQLNCLAGAPPASSEPDAVRETLVSNLRFAAAEMDKRGVRLLIEPLNSRDNPGFYLTRSAQARSIIEEVGAPNLWLQYDIYHMQIMEGDLITTIEANLDVIRHIQLADNPGRHEPGTGEINFPNVLASLDSMGYQGWVGCEYRPLTTTDESLGWAGEYLANDRSG